MQQRESEQFQQDYDLYKNRPNNLQSLNTLRDWHLDKEEPDIRGWTVKDRNGSTIGSVDDLLVDTRSYVVPFAVIGGIPGTDKRKIVPLHFLDMDPQMQTVHFDHTMDELHKSPDYAPDIKDYNPFYDYWSGVSKQPAQPVPSQEEQAAAPGQVTYAGHEPTAAGVQPQAPAQPQAQAPVQQEMQPAGREGRIRRTVTRIFRRPAAAGQEPFSGEVVSEETTIEEELAGEVPPVAGKRGEAAFEEEQKQPK